MLRPAAPEVAQAAPAAAPAPAVRYAVATVAPRVTPAVARPATAADCATGTERALRIAKPGLLGALLGAGMGAAGGAIADGGEAAGKGALIGGIAGAALGGGYGAYKTKQECGTIFGEAGGLTGFGPAPSSGTRPAALGGQGITVYQAR
jgi:hypothetical protein